MESFTALDITPGGVGLEGLRLRGPSSTWTYLINDDPFTDGLAATMMSGRNIGFAASAALIGRYSYCGRCRGASGGGVNVDAVQCLLIQCVGGITLPLSRFGER